MSKPRKSFLIVLALGLATAVVFMGLRPAETKAQKKAGLFTPSSIHDDGLENYDIRTDKKATDKIASFRSMAGRESLYVAAVGDRQVSGEETLRPRVPTLRIDRSETSGVPEAIGPDVREGKAFLTKPSSAKRPDILRSFVAENDNLFGMTSVEVANLKTVADYINPDGRLSFVELSQEINGVPVFQGEIKAGFTKSGEMIRVVNNLAPGLAGSTVSTDFGDPVNAATAAAGYVNVDAKALALAENRAASTDLKRILGQGDLATTAEKMYFPTEPGVVTPAWRVLIWAQRRAYYVIVDAATSALLWRKNLTEDQTQPASYMVYANSTNMTATSNSMINALDSPYALTPGPLDPALGTQGSGVSRSLITIVGNEPPYTFNNLGWITDGNNTTDGNNVQAGLDRKLPNNSAATDIDPDGMAIGSPSRVFNFAFNPGNPSSGGGDQALPGGQSPNTCLSSGDVSTPTAYQQASTTQLFYLVNRYHDVMYQLGFTEAAHNFQHTNFTGQGTGNDRVSAQNQDCGDINNANFTTMADGNRGFMQMYLWPGSGGRVTFDGSLDADVVLHEHTHGLSNRLHGNASGLTTNMSRGMGEGWSDFYASSLLAEPTDPVQGIYTIGGYVTANGFANLGGSNYYYGIRRYPLDVLSHTGGANNKPHNAFTFSYLNNDCNSRLTSANFAFNRNPAFATTTVCDQVHRIGEVWSSILWEARAKFIARLGAAAGNQRMLQLVTDGMKIAPIGPTFLTERDAIIAAAYAGGDANDVKDLWEGFAARGLGADAAITAIGSGANNTQVVEGMLLPNLTQTQNLIVSDITGDADGFAEPGENVNINVPITNSTGVTATSVTVSIVGGGTTVYGTMTGAQTIAQPITFTVPAGTVCGSLLSITINVNSSLGPVSFTRQIFVGKPATTSAAENFDGVAAPALPNGWTATAIQGGINFANAATTPDTAPNAMFAQDPTTVGGGTDLTSPMVSVTSGSATLSFRHIYATEAGWDGGVLEIAIGGNPFQDILTAGGTFTQGEYNSTLGGGTNNPLAGRAAWTGNSNTYITTTVQLPAAANGKLVQLKWRFGADDNTAVAGWRVDTISLSGAGFVTSYACQVTSPSHAPVSISGRVTSAQGYGLHGPLVVLIDAQGQTSGTITNPFGYYILPALPSGQTVTIKVIPKGSRYSFATQVVDVTENLTEVNFSANP